MLGIDASTSVRINNFDFISSSSKENDFSHKKAQKAHRNSFCEFCASLWLKSFRGQILIDCFDEHLGRPGGIPIETRFALVRVAGLDCLDLLQSHSLFDRILNSVANYRYHVAVFEHVMFIADPAVPWDCHGSPFLQMLGHHDVQ